MAAATDNAGFWQQADDLVVASEIVIDRPRGSAHPRTLDVHYSLDYGFLAQTRSGDGSGIDVWVGSLPERRVTGAIVTVDTLKRDAEVKLLISCTREEAGQALTHLNHGREAGFCYCGGEMCVDRGPAAVTGAFFNSLDYCSATRG